MSHENTPAPGRLFMKPLHHVPSDRRSMRATITAAAFSSLFTALCAVAGSDVYDLGDRRELFVDRHLIESMSGSARLALHEPRPAEIVLKFDAPWEGPASTYVTVFRDGPKVRMYYRSYWTPPGLKDDDTDITQP